MDIFDEWNVTDNFIERVKPISGVISKSEIVMTKEVFIEAFNKWIRKESTSDDDCISRQAVIRLVEQYPDIIGNRCSGLIADIKHLPPVTPQTKWIPVSERLPRKGEYGKVLVTYIPSGGTLWTTVMIAHYSDLMGIAKPSFHIGEVGKESFQNITEQVTAWMPLPEPYKAESEG